MAGFLRRLQAFGLQKVVIIQAEGTDQESRTEVDAHIQPDTGVFEVETPIYVGDIVEMDDPRGGRERRVAKEVRLNSMPKHMAHTSVMWGTAPPSRVAVVRRLGLENLHQEVISAASDLFSDGHFGSAVSEAFKSIEVRVRRLTGLTQSGTPLMGEAFSVKHPILDVSTELGQSGSDEREGFMALFRGAMLGVRNPRAHELFKEEDPQQALEYLGFASLLHRRLDIAEGKLGA